MSREMNQRNIKKSSTLVSWVAQVRTGRISQLNGGAINVIAPRILHIANSLVTVRNWLYHGATSCSADRKPVLLGDVPAIGAVQVDQRA
jgi:hypothetical protein